VNSANGPFGLFTKLFRKKTCINVDGLEWLRPKWKGLGSIYFRISSKLSVNLFDKIITDSNEMNKVYKTLFNRQSTIIAYGSTMTSFENIDILKINNLNPKEYFLIVGRLIPDNNSKLILKGFLDSGCEKKIVIVGDVPYNDKYSSDVKSLNSKNIIFLGYINCQNSLTALYKNCFGYIHGHEYGGTNPTMINALDLNCQILALETPFNKEMLIGKKSIFFKKNVESVSEKIQLFEKNYERLINVNSAYTIPKEYRWDFITKKYLKVFLELIS
jgi:hypothetical protein